MMTIMMKAFLSLEKHLKHQSLQKELISYQNKPYLIVSYDIYYGCSFETEIADLDYTNFDEEKLSLRTLSTPFFDYPLIEKVFFNKKN